MKYGGSIYIISNHSRSVLYVGVTSDLFVRITQHKDKKHPDSFTAKYNCNQLIYFENFSRIEEAIVREKQMKKWKREWKMKLISELNPQWKDLYESIAP